MQQNKIRCHVLHYAYLLTREKKLLCKGTTRSHYAYPKVYIIFLTIRITFQLDNTVSELLLEMRSFNKVCEGITMVVGKDAAQTPSRLRVRSSTPDATT